MTTETESILLKSLERLESELKETNRKLEKFIDATQKDLTDIKVGLAVLKGEFFVLQLINGALFISFLGAVIKFVFFPNP